MNRRWAVGFAAFATLLVAFSPVQLVGDSHEYIAMAVGIVTLGTPAPTPQELNRLEQSLSPAGVPMLRDALHEGADGRLHFRHFWMYPALAAPATAAALFVGAHPGWGFTLLNIALMSFAAGLLAKRVGGFLAAFLCVGPIIWWVDKAHPEAFVFALMAAGFATIRRRPGSALILWALAAAQYPPLTLLPLTGLAGILWRQPELRRDRRFQLSTAAALALAALHPALSLRNLGVVSPLVLWGGPAGVPGWRALTAVYTDLNIGLLVNAPFFAATVALLAAALMRSPGRREWSWGWETALAAALLLPFAFAQTTNVNHGGTPGISRYALWLLPLAVPLLSTARRATPTRGSRAATIAASASIAWCLIYYHPARLESYEEPTRVASAVWRLAPRLSSPLPEIFAERLTHRAPGRLPMATPSCSKVLLLDGLWPAPCAPSSALPESCRTPGALCYANRRAGRAGGYRFQRLPEPVPRAHARNAASWPPAIEARVGALLVDLRWWEMAASRDDRTDVLRAAQRVGWTTSLSGPGRAFVYASDPRAGGTVQLRLAEPMGGDVVAMVNGVVLRHVESPRGGDAPWTIRLPPVGEPGVALVLRADPEPAR